MKKLLLILIVSLFVGACKKETDDVKPEGTASAVLGSYALTSFRYQEKDDELNIPTMPVVQQGKNTYFGLAELSETNDPNTVQLVLSLTLDSQPIDDIDFGEVDVVKEGSKYRLEVGGDKIGSISGNTFSFDVQSDDARMAFTAKR